MPPSLFSSHKQFIYGEYHLARHWLHCVCGCGLNVACSATVFYIIGIVSGGCYWSEPCSRNSFVFLFWNEARQVMCKLFAFLLIFFFFYLLMSLSFVVMNPRVKFIMNHYRETYSSSHYPILLWKASFIFPTLSTWFISLLSLFWWNKITKPFRPWKFCSCALHILSIW